MLCWICGNTAGTGEHKLKASDMRSEFGSVSQKKPLYYNSKLHKNVRINSIRKSPIIKSNALICENCNTSRTSQDDRAWEAMSEYLRSGRVCLKGGSTINLQKVFPGKTKSGMLNVHLYFVKQFGCAIKEFGIPIEINNFSGAILNRTPHPKVFISFGASNGILTGSTDVEVATLNGKCAFAAWFYVVGNIAVNIMYSNENIKRQGLINSWHPTTVTKQIKFATYI
jgi:hypothetical protein